MNYQKICLETKKGVAHNKERLIGAWEMRLKILGIDDVYEIKDVVFEREVD